VVANSGMLTVLLSFFLIGRLAVSLPDSDRLSIFRKINVTFNIFRCTTIIASKGASTEGPMTTHTSDCSNCDFRVSKVPAKSWPKGSQRPLFVYRGQYPATVSSTRGDVWHPNNLEGSPEQIAAWKALEQYITGYIPEVVFFSVHLNLLIFE
jgi:hypothetical protein